MGGQIMGPMMTDPSIAMKVKDCGKMRRRLEGSSRRRLADCSDDLQDAFDDAYDCKEDAEMDCAAEAFGCDKPSRFRYWIPVIIVVVVLVVIVGAVVMMKKG